MGTNKIWSSQKCSNLGDRRRLPTQLISVDNRRLMPKQPVPGNRTREGWTENDRSSHCAAPEQAKINYKTRKVAKMP